jgi:drug/metabolite transporter (DMT)-like permease
MKMSVPVAYLGVIIIWSTTPLMIKWSGEGAGYLFGVSSRMVLALLITSVMLIVWARKLPMHRDAIKTYLVTGLGIFMAMMAVYYGAQHISSGLVSVLFGMTPLVTSVFAAIVLKEQSLTLNKLGGVLLGIIGLSVIFGSDITVGEHALLGIIAILLAVLSHSATSVIVKSIGADLHAMEMTHGGLMVAAPLYLVTWLVTGDSLPEQIPQRTWMSIVYLSLFGSVLGFVLFFYVLKHVEASRVALITLITPVCALWLGQMLNNEHHDPLVWTGTLLILIGMSVFQWGSLIRSYLERY